MSNYSVLFLDIDGTILKADHTIEDSTKEAIKQIKQQGIEIFLATGRPLHEVYHIAEELDVRSFIGYNGAYASYRKEIIYNRPMNPKIVDHYIEICAKHDHEMVLYTTSQNLFTEIHTDVVQQFIHYFDLKENASYDPKYNDQILGITLMNLKENDPKLYETDAPIFFSQVNVHGLTHSYDVIQDQVNKGNTIRHVLDLLKLSPEQAIAFGDGLNDKQMLQVSGASFAMGNAHPDLFSYAKYRTTSVGDNGIYNGLKTLGLIK